MEFLAAVKIVSPAILALLMFGMGLSLKVSDFTRIVTRPKPVLVGSFLQLVMLPLLGFALVTVCSLDAALALGFMLLVACPGGPGSNVVAFVCRADSALSVSLTAISTLASVVTLPLILGWSALYFDGAGRAEFSVLKVSAVMLVITLIPLLLGLAAARFWPVMDPTSSAGLRWAALLFLLLLVVSTFIRVWDRLPELLSASGLPLLILCPLSMLVAYLVTKLFRFKRAVKTTIALEVGLQNSALAIVVATTVLQMPEIALPAALYAPVIIAASLIFMFFGWFGSGLGDESPVQERA